MEGAGGGARQSQEVGGQRRDQTQASTREEESSLSEAAKLSQVFEKEGCIKD